MCRITPNELAGARLCARRLKQRILQRYQRPRGLPNACFGMRDASSLEDRSPEPHPHLLHVCGPSNVPLVTLDHRDIGGMLTFDVLVKTAQA